MIYVVHAEGTDRYKIGKAKNPTKRIGEIQTGSPVKLKLFGFRGGGAKEEAKLHKKYRSRRVTGEWFVFSPLEVQKILDEEPDEYEAR